MVTASLRNPLAVEGLTSPLSSDAEADFLFRLARSPRGAEETPRLGAIANWQRLLQVASNANAVIALREHLELAAEAVPVDVMRSVAILALDREFRMRCLEKRLDEALVALNQAGIEVLLLKGAALACTLYGAFTARPMRDIDLLVRRERGDEARDVMLQLDWENDPELPGDVSYGSHHHLPPLRDLRGSGLRLEIHRGLLASGHPFHLTDDEIWRAARLVRVGQSQALVMHPSHHAVHIAIHFAWSHMLRMGAWHAFRDLGLLTDSGTLDWNDFMSTASRWRAASCCYWTLRLAAALSHVPVPEPVLAQLQPRFAARLGGPLVRHLVNVLLQSKVCPSLRLDRALWSLAMQPRREGHGDVRPWSVSQDLLFALDEGEQTTKRFFVSPLAQMGRSGRYISEIFA